MNMSKKHIIWTMAILVSSCSLKEVENPNVTEATYLGTPQAAQSWVAGLRREMALMMNQIISGTELVSDNYFNNRTENSKVFDIPVIAAYDPDVNNIQAGIQRVREMAEFGIAKVALSDTATTNNQKAEMMLYRGYAHLVSGELFTGLPAARQGPVMSPPDHLFQAIADFSNALDLFTAQDDKLVCALLKARAYYGLGDAGNARTNAATALANPLLLKQINYDGVNNVNNLMQMNIFSSSFNEYAPLPRLDFLDPKYFNTGSLVTDQKPVTIVKAEEAYLIIAEAQIAATQLTEARQTLKDMLTRTVSKRPVTMIDGSRQKKAGGNRTDYPVTADVQAKFDSNGSPLSGYILDRQAGLIPVYPVSGTKVTATDIDNAVDVDGLMYILYRLRQEIFLAEGRRMTDLGIRLPVSLTEQQNNPHVKPENTQPRLPSFIPLNKGMDDFTFDKANKIVTMKYDMNRILVQNKNAKEIFPFIH